MRNSGQAESSASPFPLELRQVPNLIDSHTDVRFFLAWLLARNHTTLESLNISCSARNVLDSTSIGGC